MSSPGRVVSLKIGGPGLGDFLYHHYTLESTVSEVPWGASASGKVQTKQRLGQEATGKCKDYSNME